MSKDPLVTIGIPTYNRADSFFPDALRCAVQQSYGNIEIVVSDNCSTDSTEDVVRSINDPRIRYFKQKTNIPATENFNFCLKKARGDYFSLLHDDDLLDEDFVEACMHTAAGNNDIGLIRTGVRWIDNNGQVLSEKMNTAAGLPLEEFFQAWFRGEIPMHLPSTLFNTRKLVEIGGLNSRHQLFNDVIAEVKLAAMHARLDVPDIKASFRHHPDRRTTADSIRFWCEDSLELLDVMCHLASGKCDSIRSDGIRFFVGHNVRLARQIQSPLVQLRSYWTIYRYFLQPVSFLMKNVRYLVKSSLS
jgi:glycosyltransferase involved in cell wall biosynthesis